MSETKTCTKCGETKALDEFSPSKRGRYGRDSRCKTCKAATTRAWTLANPDRARETHNRTNRLRYEADPQESVRRNREVRASTRAQARNHGKEWTGPELEIAADCSRSIREVALALGRSHAAVMNMRLQIRIDPRKARMAGTDVEGTR